MNQNFLTKMAALALVLVFAGPVRAELPDFTPLVERSAPAVVNITPLTISGLTCIVVAGRGPKFRADQRQATRRLRTFAALI